MKICVIGCGAVGSLFAAHLARADEVEVWAYDVWKEHVEAIRRTGLRLSGAADFTAHLNATSDVKDLPRCDYGIVATKAIHTRTAIAQTGHIFGENSAVCSVQNGVGNEEIIAEHAKFVIRGTTFPAGHPIAPGHIGYDIRGDTWIGPFEPTDTPMNKVTGGSLPAQTWRRFMLAATQAMPVRPLPSGPQPPAGILASAPPRSGGFFENLFGLFRPR